MAEWIARHDPARELRDVAADRLLLDRYERLRAQRERHTAALAEFMADVEHQERTGQWTGVGDPGSRQHALRRETDLLDALEPELRLLIGAKASVYSVHPDYKPSWATG